MTLRPSPLAFVGLFLLGLLNVLFLVKMVWDVMVFADVNLIGNVKLLQDLPTQPEVSASIKPLAAYEQIIAHPLFSKTREPFVPPPSVSPIILTKPIRTPDKFVDPDLMVGGIIINGGTKQAFLFKKKNPNGVWIKVGEDFLGWKLQSVDAEVVTLQNNDHIITLQLYVDH